MANCSSCAASVSDFDVNCRSCGRAIAIPSTADQLAQVDWTQHSQNSDPLLAESDLESFGGLSVGGILGGIGRGLKGAAFGAIEGGAAMADSVAWGDPDGRSGWVKKDRTERAIRDSRK